MYDPNEDTDPTSLQPPSFVLVPLNAAAKRAVEHRRNQYYLHYMDEGTQGLWIAFDGDKGSYTLGNGEGSDIYLPETRTNKGSAQIDALHAEFTLIADQGAVLLVNHSGDLTRTTTFTIPNRGPSSTVPIDEESQSVLVARGINPCIALGNNRLFQFEIRWYTPGLYAFDPIEPYVLGPRRSAQKRYLQGQRIGGGSSSTVWTALDCRLGSVIVVKKFNNLAGPGRKQLAREAEIFRRGSASGSAKPRHDHILEILDILTDRNTDWLEFLLPLKQCDLRTLVEQDAGSIGEEVSDTVLRQMLLALECLHEHSMTHGNLRPEKVFCEYDEDGNLNLYLCPQFGRQPYLHGKERSLFTAPEVSHKKKQTIKSDMWSLFSMVCWIRNEDGFRFNANKLSGNQIHHWINFLAKKEAFSRIRGMAESNPKKRPSPSEQLQRLDDIQEFGEEENEGDEFAREEEEEEEEEGLLEEGDDEEGSNKSSAYPYYEPYTSPLPDTYARYPTYEPYTTKLIDDEDNMEASSSLQAAAYDSDDLTEAPSMWIQEPPLDVEVASSGKGKGKRREFVGAPLRKEPATASHGPEPSEEADWVHVAKLPLAKSIADLDGNPVSLKSSTPPPEAAGKGKGKGKGKEVSGTKLATAPAAPPKKQSGSGSQERHGPGAAASAPDKPAVKRSVDLDGASSPLKPFTFPPEVAVTGEISGGRVASGPPQKEPFEGSSDLDGLQEETERVTKPPPAKPTADSDDDLVPVESSIPPPMAPVKEGQGKETFGTPLQKEPAAGSQGPDGLEEDTERVTKTPPLTSTADLDENSDTLGSSASLLGVAGPVAVLLLQPFFKNFLQFVAEEPNLSSLYKQAVNIVNERDFEAHLNQLLEAYGRSLGDEAQTPMQKETASLVQRSATQVVRTIKKGIISREEEYRTGETVGTHQEQDIDSVGETATRLARDDTKDGNGDDEVSSLEEEYQRLSQDAGFEEFLTSTQAFDTLFESIKTWLGTNRQREEVSMVALRVEMSSQRFGLQRGLIPASADSPSEREIDEVYSPVDLVRWFKEAAELTHGTKGPDPNEYTTLRRTQTFWSVQSEDSSEGEGGISASEDGLVEREMPGGFPDDAADDLELDDESAGEGVLGFKLIAAFARWIHEPRLLPGYKRLRWRCSCGKTLFGDFADDNPVALLTQIGELRVDISISGEHDGHVSNWEQQKLRFNLGGSK
ncbi:hypothetical protein OQA88_765 [Cercophora sp. LCS_1]